jgi:hypothetical protein
MNKPSSQLLQLTRRRAGFTLHQLLDEIQLLTVAFPDVRDAFDADELPIAFILKRDAPRSTRNYKRRAPNSTPGRNPIGVRKRLKGREHLLEPRKQPLDD